MSRISKNRMSKWLIRIGQKNRHRKMWRKRKGRKCWKKRRKLHLEWRKSYLKMKRKCRLKKTVTVSITSLMRVKTRVPVWGRRHRKSHHLICEKSNYCSSCMNKKSASNMSKRWKRNRKSLRCFNRQVLRCCRNRSLNMPRIGQTRNRPRRINGLLPLPPHIRGMTRILWWWMHLLRKSLPV